MENFDLKTRFLSSIIHLYAFSNYLKELYALEVPNQQPVNPYGQPVNQYGGQPMNQYGQPVPMAPVVSVKEWMLTMLVMAIPIVNIIMMFVWAFSNGENPSKANYFKASLIWAAIILGIYVLIIILIFGIFAAAMN